MSDLVLFICVACSLVSLASAILSWQILNFVHKDVTALWSAIDAQAAAEVELPECPEEPEAKP